MRHLLVTLHLLSIRLDDHLNRLRQQARTDERGSLTIEQVAWAVAIIAIVALAVAAIRSYVATQTGKLS